MSIALARRYRPRRFADLLVQDHVAAALRGAVAKQRVGHGYLLTGPRGVGKTTAARILAMALNCERRDLNAPTGEPCGECSSCQRIWNGTANLDVVEIDAASNRGVDDARDLRERAMYAASQAGHHKVYIIDEAHMLTREAWNALLKILEEPPPGVVFVFATTEPQKIANTAAPVLSRLQRFDFRRIGPAAIQSRLREVLKSEQLEAEDDALLLIARHADGGMRDALSVLDQCLSFGEGPVTAARVREVLGLADDEAYAAVLALVAERQPGAVFAVIDRLMEAGTDLAEFTGGLAEHLRAVVMKHYGAEPEGMTEAAKAAVAAASTRLSPEDAVRMLKVLGESEHSVRRSANPRIALETLLLRWALMDRAVDLRALLAGALAEPVAVRPPSAASARKPIPEGRSEPAAKAAAPATSPSPVPVATEKPVRTGPIPKNTYGLRAAWGEVVATATQESRILGQALEHAAPRVDETGVVILTFAAGNEVFRDGVAQKLAVVEGLLGSLWGGKVGVRVETGVGEEKPPAKAPRLSVDGLKAERLAQLRAKDPALDAAADALDLELVDDG